MCCIDGFEMARESTICSNLHRDAHRTSKICTHTKQRADPANRNQTMIETRAVYIDKLVTILQKVCAFRNDHMDDSQFERISVLKYRPCSEQNGHRSAFRADSESVTAYSWPPAPAAAAAGGPRGRGPGRRDKSSCRGPCITLEELACRHN